MAEGARVSRKGARDRAQISWGVDQSWKHQCRNERLRGRTKVLRGGFETGAERPIRAGSEGSITKTEEEARRQAGQPAEFERGQRLQQKRHCQRRDRKSTRLNSSHPSISYAVFCLKKKTKQ